MAKRSATETAATSNEGQAYSKVPATGNDVPRRSISVDEMGEFEDEWEDELESDGEVVDGGENDEDEDSKMEVDVTQAAEDEDETPAAPDVYLPGSHKLAEDEVLEADQSVYEMLHQMNVTWPCLSFDILRDSLGDNRQTYPASTYVVTGTQADIPSKNEVMVMKMSRMCKTQKDNADSDDSDDEDDDAEDEDAILEFRSIPHAGGVNRIRAQPLASLPSVTTPYHAATWAETGKVHIWDIRPLMESLDVPGYVLQKSQTSKPVHTVNQHGRTEGFGLDWGTPIGGLRLLSGDLDGCIFLTTATQSGFTSAQAPFTSHTAPVEDIQWSPSEATVFASCSSDKSVRVWDVRTKGKKSAAQIVKAHESDVNVMSWNRGTTYLLATGGDEGGIKIWDLRNLKGVSSNPPSPVAHFSWHTEPITSIEWHPSEDSVFAASGSDDQVTLWDLSVEQDEDEVGTKEIHTANGQKLKDVPSQLLFVHQGQSDVKEIHWHPQIPGCLISTAYTGFNVFKTISV
ncbi:Ribosome assembly protein rrb1 [Schizosaccharomyces pombe 972h-] [Rhizoctonia solani]|uniref:Glutamate-rich WD repeat-containing protein 1 n=1 Tax=Rhizoctonia solani TaxID=456999 RepID=A0A0K6FMS8_9AGAM|nr:Ribosome assembly protein rrb1 [Schizosaccharomyces pombe 972h-] [Rhizoctonia solani]